MRLKLMFALLTFVCFHVLIKCNADNAVRRSNLLDNKKFRPSYTLAELSEKYKDALESGLKHLLPLALKASTEAKLNSKCTRALYRIIIGVRQLEEWAISLVDASGKIHSGIFDGTASDFGDYDACLAVSAQRDGLKGDTHEIFAGQYCLAQFLPPPLFRYKDLKHSSTSNLTINEQLGGTETIFKKLFNLNVGPKSLSTRFGVCIPSTCSGDDLKNALDVVLKSMEVEVNVISCQARTNQYWGSEHVGLATIIGVLFIMVCVGTIMDVVFRRRKHLISRSLSPNDYCMKFWRSLSILISAKKLVSATNGDNEQFLCMKGIRVITMFWIVLSNCYFLPHVGFFYRLKRLVSPTDYHNDVLFGLLSNPSPAIDTLFFMSGMLISYEAGKRFLFKGVDLQLWKSFWRTFLRFLLPVLFTIWIFVILPSMGDGPQWIDLVNRSVDVCRISWWKSLLFIQNFWSYNENCMIHTWVISLLVQYSFLSVMLVSMLYKKPKLGIFFNVMVIIGAAGATGYMNFQNHFPPNLSLAAFNTEVYEKIMDKDHLRTYTHIGPFCIGLLAGCFLLKRKKVQFHTATLWAGWILCLFTICAVIYGLHRFPYEGQLYTTLSAIYSATHRIGWSLSLAWICLLCATRHGGLVNEILSWRVFIQLDHLSYFVYLLHPLVIYYFAGRARERLSFGHPEMILSFVGILTITLIWSFLAYLFFYFPLKRVDTFLFERKKSKAIEEETDKDVLDTEAVISLYKSEGVISRKSSLVANSVVNGESCSGVQVDAYLRKKRKSSVVFNDQPEILNEESLITQRRNSEVAQRKNSEVATPHGQRKKKSSLKNDNEAQAIKNTLMGEQSTIREETVRNAGTKNESFVEDNPNVEDDVFVNKDSPKSKPTNPQNA